MTFLRSTFVLAALATSASQAFSQSMTDFRAAATKAFPATVLVSFEKVDGSMGPGRHPRDQSQESMRSMLRPGDRSMILLRNVARLPFAEPSVAGVAIAPDLVIVATTGSTGDVIHLRAASHQEVGGSIIVSDFVTGLSVVRLDASVLAPITLSERPLEPGQPVLMTQVAKTGETIALSGMIASLATSLHQEPGSQELGFVHRLDLGSHNFASGTPVVDEHGDLVGIAVLVNSGAVCLPVSSITRLIEMAQSDSPSDLRPGRLGVVLSQSGDSIISELLNESPAGKAGLQPNDRIVSVGGQPTATTADVIASVAMHRGGDTVEIVADRDGKNMPFTIILDTDKSQRGKMPSIHAPLMWRLEDGKLVQIDEKLGEHLRHGWGPLMLNMGDAKSNGPFVISPPEVRSITIERGGLDEILQRLQSQLEQTQKQQQEIVEKLRQLATPTEGNNDHNRAKKSNVEK